MVGTKGLESGAVDVLLRQQIDGPPVGVVHPGPQRQQILRRSLHDRGELLFLRVGGVDLDVQVLERAVEMRVQRRGIEHAPHESAALPCAIATNVSKRAGADDGRQAGDDRRDGRAPEETATRVVATGG